MKVLLTVLIIPFFTLILFTSYVFAQTNTTNDICPGAVKQTPCTFKAYDSCNNKIYSCTYSGTINGGHCEYAVDQKCNDSSCSSTPPACGTTKATCSSECSTKSGYSYGACQGSSYCYGDPDSNGCKGCQGFFYCACSNGSAVDIACDPKNLADQQKGCGTDSLPCSPANSYNAYSSTSCNAASPPPACTFSYINVNGGGSYAEVPSGGTISINWAVTGADNTKSCTWVSKTDGVFSCQDVV